MTDTELETQSPARKQDEGDVPYRTEAANPQPLTEASNEAEPEKKGKKKKSWQRELLEWVLTFAIALLIVFVVRSFIFEPVYVDGDSMYPTLHNGEIMYVSKTSYGTSFFGIPFTDIGVHFTVGGEPERFDVVVCNFPNRTDRNTGARTNFVKRVVGLPGDTVEIKGGYLYVNGVRQEEKFLHERIERDWPTKSFRDKFMDGANGPYTVPEGMYLVMGDNRNNSNDSRSYDVGPISRDMIVGHVEAVLWHTIPSTLEDSGLKD